MNEGEKKHIRTNLSELVSKTCWRTSCKIVPIEKDVFGDEDVAVLESIPNEPDRIFKFYRIFMTKENSYKHLIATLEAGCQSGAVKILNRFDGNIPVAGTSIKKAPIGVRFDVRQPVRFFTGRLNQLAELHEKLQQSKSKPTIISQMASIVGLGGIGKTELARMYIQQFGEDYDNNLIWISAETEETLRESFQRLATDYLKISLSNVDGKEKHMMSVIEEVYNFFRGKPCLFLFDNAESTEDIQKFLPLQVADPPYVLITSRDREWSFDVEVLELHEMEESEAIAFVTNGLQIQDQGQHDALIKLVKTLQFFPLALSQAISYIKQKKMLYNYSISQYLKEFQTCSKKLLSCETRPAALNPYTKTTFTTWKLTTQFIFANEHCGKEAMRMLNMISYFQPDKIPTKLLLHEKPKNVIQETIQGIENATSSMPFQQGEENEKALHLLVKYSMINIQPTEETISIHRLVQEVTRIELIENHMVESTLEYSLRLLSENLELKTINHFCSVYKYCGEYRKLVVDFKQVPSKVIQELDGDLLSGRCSGVRTAFELKQILQKHVSSDDDDLNRLEFWIAMASYRIGNCKIASKGFEQILPTYIENKDGRFTKDEIITVQYFLAVCLREIGKRSESLKLLLETYKSAKTLYGGNGWWTIQVLVQIAECLQKLGHFKKPFPENTENIQVSIPDFILPDPQEIISLLRVVYENNRHLISTHPNHARNMFRIASFFDDIRDNDTARTIANDVYEQGRNSNNTKVRIESMKCLNFLGFLNKNEGKFEEALDTYKEAHAFSSKTLGGSHPITLLYKANMLEMLGFVGEGEAALSGLREVLETLVTSYPNHHYRCSTELRIGIILYKFKRYDEGLALLLDSRKRSEERFGQTYPQLAKVNYWIRKLRNSVVECMVKKIFMNKTNA